MPKKPKIEPITLKVEQIAAFQAVVKMVLDTANKQQVANDCEGGTEMLNQLFYSVPEDDFERFKGIIQDAGDSDFRCPK